MVIIIIMTANLHLNLNFHISSFNLNQNFNTISMYLLEKPACLIIRCHFMTAMISMMNTTIDEVDQMLLTNLQLAGAERIPGFIRRVASMSAPPVEVAGER